MKWTGLGAALALALGCLPAGLAMAEDMHVLIAGQVMLQHHLSRSLAAAPASDARTQAIQRGLDEVLALVRQRDAVILELESALALGSGQPPAAEGGRDKDSDFFHEIDAASVTDLIRQQLRVAPGHLAFAAANNHAGDNGKPGIAALHDLFGELQVPLAGIGMLKDASAPRTLSIPRKNGAGQAFSLVAFATDKVKWEAGDDTMGVNTVSVVAGDTVRVKASDEQRVADSIAAAARQSIVVAYHHNHHWNQSKVNEAGGTEAWRADFAHRLLDRGADVYFAHGEPRLQGIEIYRGKPIFYGLGNLVFQTRKLNFYRAEVWESLIVDLRYEDAAAGSPPRARLAEIRLIPVVLNEHGVEPVYFQTRGLPALARGAQAQAILARMQSMSQALGTRIDIEESAPGKMVGVIRIAQENAGAR